MVLTVKPASLAWSTHCEQQPQVADLYTVIDGRLPCGCCSQWVNHAKEAGFTVKTIDTDDLAAVKRNMSVPARLQSCHTVLVGSYVIEGHVPAADVKRLLTEKPKVRGLAVPGMPVGSPGMEQGSPANYDRYDVISFTTDGTQAVFASHGPPRQ